MSSGASTSRPAVPRLDVKLEDATGNPAAGEVVTVTPLLDDINGANLTASGYAFVGDAIVGEEPVTVVLGVHGEGSLELAALRYRIDRAGGGFIVGTLSADTRAEDLPE